MGSLKDIKIRKIKKQRDVASRKLNIIKEACFLYFIRSNLFFLLFYKLIFFDRVLFYLFYNFFKMLVFIDLNEVISPCNMGY